jgi:membrane protein YdbS with pleckstrin-like domain
MTKQGPSTVEKFAWASVIVTGLWAALSILGVLFVDDSRWWQLATAAIMFVLAVVGVIAVRRDPHQGRGRPPRSGSREGSD